MGRPAGGDQSAQQHDTGSSRHTDDARPASSGSTDTGLARCASDAYTTQSSSIISQMNAGTPASFPNVAGNPNSIDMPTMFSADGRCTSGGLAAELFGRPAAAAGVRVASAVGAAESAADPTMLAGKSVVASAAPTPEPTASQPRPEPPVTDLNGKVCAVQPKPGFTPVLESGVQSRGCEYKDLKSLPPPKDRGGQLNAAELNAEVQPSVVRMLNHEKSGVTTAGTGVVFDKGPKSCFVATATHVTRDNKSLEAVMPNGKTYSAAEVPGTEEGDKKLVEVKTGDDTESVCRPAKFLDPAIMDEKGKFTAAVIGFPGQTTTPYYSPGAIKPDSMAGLYRNENRDLFAHIEQGNSGGPFCLSTRMDGKTLTGCVGLVSAKGTTEQSTMQPIHPAVIESWRSKIPKH